MRHGRSVQGATFNQNESHILSWGEDGAVRLWRAPEWKGLRKLKGHDIAVYAVSFSPDGATLAAATGNNAIAFWNPHTGELKRLLKDAMTIPLRKY
jgi:WD40 repeat protein